MSSFYEIFETDYSNDFSEIIDFVWFSGYFLKVNYFKVSFYSFWLCPNVTVIGSPSFFIWFSSYYSSLNSIEFLSG